MDFVGHKLRSTLEEASPASWSLEGAAVPLGHRWQTQGLQAESGPLPCFIPPSTLFLPGSSTELAPS